MSTETKVDLLQPLEAAFSVLAWIAGDAAPGWNYLSDAARAVLPEIESAIRKAKESQ